MTCTFSILQATSLVSFYNALPFFTCFTIVTALFSIGYTIREWRVHDNQLAKIFLVPWCLLIVATIIEGIHFFLGYIDAYGQFVHLAVIFFIIINTIIGAMILRKAFALREQNRRMEQEYKLMEVQVSNQQRYNHLLLETRQLLRQQRHDLRHQLAVIQSHAQVGALDQLNHHLESVVNQIPEELESYCENLAVNAVVAYYTGKSKAMGIAVTIQLSVPESLERINDSSLCVIFGNILENAVEACQRMNGGTPFITLTSYIRNDMLVITQKNSYQDPPRTDGTSFLSSKDQTTGIGLSSVKSTAHKHNGNAIFIAENGVFHSSAYVRI